jgi:hypothetical protein
VDCYMLEHETLAIAACDVQEGYLEIYENYF